MACKLNTCDIIRQRVELGNSIFDFYCTVCKKPIGVAIPKDLCELYPPPPKLISSDRLSLAAEAEDFDKSES